MALEPATIVSLVVGILGFLTGAGSLIITYHRLGPERRKLEAEARRANAEAHNIDIDSLADLNDKLMAEIGRLRKEMCQERAETEAACAALRQDLDKAMIDLAQAQQQIQADGGRIAQLQADNERLKKALERSLDAARRLKRDLDQAKADLAQAKSQITALENGNSPCPCTGGSHGEKAKL